MVKKDFTFHGKTVDELNNMSFGEFLKLIPARERRTIKRGYTKSAKMAIEKMKIKKGAIKTQSREIVIVPDMIGKRINVHKGNGYTEIEITDDMIGHRIGEFVLCNKKVTHGKAGLGATGGSKTETRK